MDLPIGYLLKVITDRMKARADLAMKNHGLTLSQSRVLTMLQDRGGRAMQKEIEDFLHVSHPTVVGLVSRMEQNGFVETWSDSKDRRNKVVCMTDKARSIVKEMGKMAEWNEQQLVKSLTHEQTETFRTLLKIIYENLT